MDAKQFTALLLALTTLQGAFAQTTTVPVTINPAPVITTTTTTSGSQTLSGGSLVITGSNLIVTGASAATNVYKQPQQFMKNGQLYPASLFWNASAPPSPPGTLNCVDCAPTDANYVGPYALNMSCPNPDNQYHPAWGGTCWACPGPVRIADLYSYKLSGDPTNGGSCFKRLNPWLYAPSKMTKGGVSSGVMSWDCAAGEFWQMYDNKGNWTWWGGACYSCPAGYGWNGRGPTSGSDCVKPDDYATPRLANFNGCPQPDSKAMGLAGMRTPDKPFLDIAAGWSQGATGGGCYACPAILEDGSIVVTERNLNTLIGKPTGNNGCNVKVSYKPLPFPEPGLMGIDGVRDLVTERFYFEVPQLVTAVLHAAAESNGIAADSAAARQFVKSKWDEIAANPAASVEFRSLVFGAIREAAFKQKPTDAEKIAVAAFSEYIRRRKLYVADVALNMYDTWKPVNDRLKASTRVGVQNMFYYGNVPFDFAKVAESALGFGGFTAFSLAAAAASTGNAIAIARTGEKIMTQFFAEPAYSQYGNVSTLIRSFTLGVYDGTPAQEEAAKQAAKTAYQVLKARIANGPTTNPSNVFTGNLLKNLTTLRGFATNVGPMLVMTAASFLIQCAIEQAIAIETARPKLLAAREAAAAPVNLAALLSDPANEDMVFMLWNKAMTGQAYGDPSMVQAAAAANKMELARGYAKPIK